MAELELREAMCTLRAVRRLKPDAISDEVVGRILEAAIWAPTGGNTQSWRVVVVRDRGEMTELGLLYSEGSHTYAQGRQTQLAEPPETVRISSEKMIAAGDYFAANFDKATVLL